MSFSIACRTKYPDALLNLLEALFVRPTWRGTFHNFDGDASASPRTAITRPGESG
jgi:hypothetical protein